MYPAISLINRQLVEGRRQTSGNDMSALTGETVKWLVTADDAVQSVFVCLSVVMFCILCALYCQTECFSYGRSSKFIYIFFFLLFGCADSTEPIWIFLSAFSWDLHQVKVNHSKLIPMCLFKIVLLSKLHFLSQPQSGGQGDPSPPFSPPPQLETAWFLEAVLESKADMHAGGQCCTLASLSVYSC